MSLYSDHESKGIGIHCIPWGGPGWWRLLLLLVAALIFVRIWMKNWSEESETWEEKSKRKNLWSIAAATAATALLGCCQLSWHKYSNSNRLLLFEYLSNSWFWMTGSGQGRSYICETFIEMNVGIEITTIYISETFYSKFAKVYTPYLFFFLIHFAALWVYPRRPRWSSVTLTMTLRFAVGMTQQLHHVFCALECHRWSWRHRGICVDNSVIITSLSGWPRCCGADAA